MRLHRALITTFAVATIALAGTAPPASAATTLDVSVDVDCPDGGYIDIVINNPDGTYDFFANDQPTASDATQVLNDGSYDDGLVTVEIFEAGTDNLLWTMDVPVACNEPYIDVIVECQEDGGHLLMLVAYPPETEIDAYVDNTDTPVQTGLEDTNFEYVDLGKYANGDHEVYGDWADFDGEGMYFHESVGVKCTTDQSGSGAGIPSTGSNSGSLALIAGLFVAAGAALLVVRRTRTA